MENMEMGQFIDFLERRKYKLSTIKIYTSVLNELEGIDDIATIEEAMCFINEIREACLENSKSIFMLNNQRAALLRWFEFKFNTTIPRYCTNLTHEYNDDVARLLEEYYEYSVNFKSIKNTTAKAEKYHVLLFLNHISYNKNYDFNQLKTEDIISFITTSYENLKPSSKGRYLTSLRNFIRFLEYKGLRSRKSFGDFAMYSANWGNRMVPVTISEDDDLKLRNYFTGDSEKQLRNRIIYLLMVDIGLRACELPNLQIKDVHWKEKSLLIRKTKTNTDRIVPLTPEILNLLEKYLLNYRTQIISPFLLVTLNERKSTLQLDTEEIRRVIRHAYSKNNIHGYWKGTHALRRTAATHIFRSTENIKITADILGHNSLDSTKHYIRTDFELLRSIASPWPGGNTNE